MLTARPLDAEAAYRLLARTHRLQDMKLQELQTAFDAGQFLGFVAEEEQREVGALVVELQNIDDVQIHLFEGDDRTRTCLVRQLLSKARDKYLEGPPAQGAGPSP